MSRINVPVSLLCLLMLLLLLLASPTSWALRSDRNQPINIKADRVEINEKTEISHYQGNVYLKQGTLVITADSVKVYLKQGKLIKIFIDGKPATFEQKPEDNKDIVQSRARHMEYYANKQILILKKDARVIQGPNNFSGDFIEYDTLNSTVKAKKDEGSDSRVHAIIHPKSDKSDTDTTKDKPKSKPTSSSSKSTDGSKSSTTPNNDTPTK